MHSAEFQVENVPVFKIMNFGTIKYLRNIVFFLNFDVCEISRGPNSASAPKIVNKTNTLLIFLAKTLLNTNLFYFQLGQTFMQSFFTIFEGVWKISLEEVFFYFCLTS